MAGDTSRQLLRAFGLAVFILVPSFDTIGKYFGPVGIVLYSIVGLAAVFAGWFLVIPHFVRLVSERSAQWLAVATLAGLIVIVTIGYPLANSGRFGGGTDVDDAMIIAVTELLKGNYPYYLKTYLGLPISPMPGSIFLAVPWVAANALPYQNIFWLAVLYLLARHILKSGVWALGLFWAFLVLSPTVHQSLVTGSDYISNSVYVLVGAWLVLRYSSDPDAPAWKSIASAAFLGLGLSSRSNFLLVVPMIFLVLVRSAGWAAAIRSSGVAMAVFAAVTVPFWAYDPAGFSPFTAQAWKVRVLEQVVPYAGVLIPGSALVIAAALSFRQRADDLAAFLRNNGIVQLYLLLFTAIVYAIQASQLNLFMANSGYGLFALFFGAAGCWMALMKGDPASPAGEFPMRPKLD